MNRSTMGLLPARRLSVRRSAAKDAAVGELEVPCPLVRVEVHLQRCASCRHAQGLLLDPNTDGLTMRCSFPEYSSDGTSTAEG